MSTKVPSCIVGAALAMGCASGPPPPSESHWTTPPTGLQNVTSGSPLEAYFPLVDGHVYLYQTLNEVGEPGLLVARVHRVGPQRGELRYASGSKHFAYEAGGVMFESASGGAFVLKAPLEPGTSWRGEHGGKSRILAVNTTVEVPAGKFEGCVQVLEERGGDAPVKYATTFCKGVGVVLLEAATGANLEKAELKSYGPPQDFGPDGTTKFQTKAPTPAP